MKCILQDLIISISFSNNRDPQFKFSMQSVLMQEEFAGR